MLIKLKMDNIKIVDNFLNAEELKTAVGIVTNNRWNWGHNSIPNQIDTTPFWNMDLFEDNFFSIYLKEVLERHFSKKYKLNRVYANGQTFGQDGSFHQDDTKENTYTFCLYLTDIDKKYVDVAGGYIFFKFPDKKYNVC